MVKKLKKWRNVEKRFEYVQIDVIGHDKYLISLFDEHVQYVCDYKHIEKMINVLNIN